MEALDVLDRFDLLKRIPWLNRQVLGNTLHDYILTALSFVALWLLLSLVRSFSLRRLAKREGAGAYDALNYAGNLARQIWPIVFPLVAFSLATRRLHLPTSTQKILSIGTIAVCTLQMIVLLSDLAGYLLRRSRLMGRESDQATRASTENLIALSRLGLWIAGILFLLDNAGVNISTFVAGLGISGVAIALAAQAVLGDTFSSFAIAMDKPFEVGDFIVVDQLAGNVERVGFKTTRVRSLSGELLIFANSDLTKSRIKNFRKMRERRVNFQIGVAYGASLEQLREVPALIKQVVEATPNCRFERAHFHRFGETALLYDIVFWITDPDYMKYMDATQAINLRILGDLEKMGVAMVPGQKLPS